MSSYQPRKEIIEIAKQVAAKIDADVFLYNGEIAGGADLKFIELIHANKQRDRALLLLTTYGGDPDAAYRICRYLQERYEQLTVLVGGKCKSAGTLIAVGATELAFAPYGELGPLDIQLTKVDKFDQAQSGLTIQDALNTLEDRAKSSFYTIVQDYMSANRGQLSFPAASKVASDFVTALYAPIFSRIDPEEVGARARSMRIADDYGKRLEAKWQNLKSGTLGTLAEKYSSHSFVIDRREANQLFHRVRSATDFEMALIIAFGNHARHQIPADGASEVVIYALSPPVQKRDKDHDPVPEGGRTGSDGENPEGSGGSQEPAPPAPEDSQAAPEAD
jgi:hypothetical protein